ncbi:ATP phosphoribosyltransferase regulatory subunit [Acetobacterium woodii]|uniref:ATP phosphoribosyltransferase regulatory subunit n=1 Tax=Acetobacterium woodii (strain ATCC 29683 / DSM 1030 / JCM 2381 / KCTC 1655 / WB1) TaxID=931626 RepID=H6LC45_ACEWD|nr:ATP phosphoribosyltransferase regulatory subunit [Acetobacterium woodii]AFA48993.1 histidyl-tRNA synthetase HisZ [Acetobacterium woodii DSM 1030]
MLFNYTIDGFENIQHQDYFALQQINRKLLSLYRSYGYHQISTPTFETYDLYVNEDSIPSDDLFKLVNHQGKVLVLKPDATLPVTRMAAMNHPNNDDIIKFSYETNIYRNFSSPEIIKKEITQIGIEYFGNDNPECDAEVIAMAIQSLLINDINDVHIDLGHVGFINFLFDDLAFSAKEKATLFKYIENKNIGDITDYLNKLTLPEDKKAIILKLPLLYGKPIDVLNTMKALCINDKMRQVVKNISEIYAHLDLIGLAEYVSFDLGFTNQMNYYSDINFKGYINSCGEPVISGGRYNHLSEKFGIPRPACGFAIDLLKVIDYMEQHQLRPCDNATIHVIFYEKNDKLTAYQLADELRQADKIAEVFMIKSTLADQVNKLHQNPLYKNANIYYLSQKKLFLEQNDEFFAIDTIFAKSEVK